MSKLIIMKRIFLIFIVLVIVIPSVSAENVTIKGVTLKYHNSMNTELKKNHHTYMKAALPFEF